MGQDESTRKGGYSSQDFFSGRHDRVERALTALLHSPSTQLEVYVDGKLVALPELNHELRDLGIANPSQVIKILSGICNVQASTLLSSILRTQCNANGNVTSLAPRLHTILRQRTKARSAVRHTQHIADAQVPLVEQALRERAISGPSRNITVADLEVALARGFWTLPADESGMHQREREGERLMERAQRELWVEGSASRRELEAQVRKFLVLHELGNAANKARFRLRLAKPSSPEALIPYQFMPLQSVPDLWYRFDLVDLQVAADTQ